MKDLRKNLLTLRFTVGIILSRVREYLTKLTSLPDDVETLPAIWQKYGPIVDGVDFSKQRRALREWGGSLPPKVKAAPVATVITALEGIKLAVKLVSDYGGPDYKNKVGKIRWWDSFVEDFKGLIDSGAGIGAWYNPWDKTLKVGLIKNRPPEVANYYLRLKPPKKGHTVAWP